MRHWWFSHQSSVLIRIINQNRSSKQEAANGRGDGGKMEAAKKDKVGSKLSVERVYQKKTQLEHILLRPDTYIGSVEPVSQVSPEY